jgi:hypothetical protein
LPRIDPAKRAAIEADIRARRKGRNEIARDHGVSVGSVTRIAQQIQDNQEPPAFDRSSTKRATEAKIADDMVKRQRVSRAFLDRAEQLLGELDRPYLVFNFGGKDNTYNEHQLEKPPVEVIRNLITSAAVAFDKHLAQDRHDSERGDEARSLLADLVSGLRRPTRSPAETYGPPPAGKMDHER